MGFVDLYARVATLIFGPTHFAVAYAIGVQGCCWNAFFIDSICINTNLSRDFVGAVVDDLVHLGLLTRLNDRMLSRPLIPKNVFDIAEPTKTWSEARCVPKIDPLSTEKKKRKRKRPVLSKHWAIRNK